MNRIQNPSGMRRGRARLNVILVAILICLLGLPLAYIVLSRTAAPVVNIPSPNAVDTLAGASSQMTGHMELIGEKSMEELEDVEAIRKFLADNSEASDLYQLALGQGCVPVVDYEKGLQDVFDDESMVNFRTAFYIPRATARLANLENRPNEAARIYADMFAIASKFGSEGLLIHTQVGFAYERLGLQNLNDIADSLDATTRDEVRQLIESIGRKPRDIDAILRRERILLNNEHGALQMAFMTFMTFMTRNLSNDALEMTQETDNDILKLLTEVLEKLKP